MTIGYLRAALDRMGHDDDQSEVVLVTTDSVTGERVYSLLVGVAMAEKMKAIMFLDESQTLAVQREGK